MTEQIYHIMIPIILALLTNGIIYFIGLNKENKENKENKDKDNKDKDIQKYLPKGYIVGIIWIIIFGLLGYAHYLIFTKNEKRITFSSLSIIFVLIYCLLYPFITKFNFKSGLLLNIISLILAFTLGIIIILESKFIFLFIIPLIVWSSYVNIISAIVCSK
jgi:tryptophan-rich sensory protein